MKNLSAILKPQACLIILSLFASFFTLQSQELIDFPPGGGTTIGDILHADGMIYAYSSDKITVYNAATSSKIDEVPLSNWGKFNPSYFNPVMWTGEYNMMEENTTTNYVYAFSPELQLIVMNGASKIAELELKVSLTGDQELSDLLNTQNGRVIMKYDPTVGNERLYVLLDSRDPGGTGNINYPGCFHQRKTFFGIYRVHNSLEPDVDGYLTLLHSEIIDFDEDNEYGDQINNFEFNMSNQNYFYLTRLNKFEIWGISNAGVVGNIPLHTEEVNNTYYNEDDFYKFGKMLNINTGQNGLHKIIIVPYRFPNVESNEITGKIYVIDGNHTDINIDASIKEVHAPSKRITDIVFLESTEDLVMSYSPDNDIQSPAATNTDIAVYSYQNIGGADSFVFSTSINTNQLSNTSAYDINYSIHLTKVENGSNNTILISKKDQIVKMLFDDINNVYTIDELREAENNTFRKGVSGSGKTYVLNSTMGKLEVFSNPDFEYFPLKTGHPIYHVTATPDGSSLLFYNKLNAEKTGVYSILNQTTSFVDFKKPIGDCIFNPYQNHFLVSKFTSDEAKVFVLDATNNMLIDSLTIPNEIYVKELFIAPDGKLYIMTNMIFSSDPKIFIYKFDEEAGESGKYVQAEIPITVEGISCSDAFLYYTACFDSRWVDDDPDIFISIRPHDLKTTPYNTETNFKYFAAVGSEYYNNGKFLFLNNGLQKTIPVTFPNKIVCPVKIINANSSQYENLVIISGKYLIAYNIQTDEIITTTQMPPISYEFIYIIYDESNDQLFALQNTVVNEEDENRSCTIWDIDIDQNTLAVEQNNIAPIPGQAATFFANPYDGKVYLHRKVDNEKLGENQMSLHSFNPADVEPVWSSQELGLTSYAPEYDQTSDPLRSNYYNLTTPYINPFQNIIYLPNGGHSNVSVVTFEALETLTLTAGTNWISIPRHKGNIGSQQGESYPTKNVFDKNNSFQTAYTKLELKHNKTEANNEVLIKARYNYSEPNDWDYQGDMIDTYSYRGYKLELIPDQSNTLYLEGFQEDPNTYITLFPDSKKNWVGYYIKEEQDVLDALANILDDIYVIKYDTYFCYFGHVMDGPSAAQPPVPSHSWHCNTALHNIKYGQMVEIWAKTQLDFIWNYSGNPPLVANLEGPEFYTFTEQADYDMLMVELDTTENPIEIGAFVNDSCVGASLVGVDDTVVGMQIYDEGITGDITFEQYYGTKASVNNTIREYSVFDKGRRKNTKRSLNTRELDGHAFVSLRSNMLVQNNTNNDIDLICYPNPANELLFIDFTINKETEVRIDVVNSLGQVVALLVNGHQLGGSQKATYRLEGFDGEKLNTGLYSVRLRTGDKIIIKKIIVL